MIGDRPFLLLFICLLVAVLNGGVIVGAYLNNGAIRCGASVCRPISGMYIQDDLVKGYQDVVTIPAGASNISITEVITSTNFLVLRSENGNFVLNGDYRTSPSGIYKAAGTVFDYKRIDTKDDSSHKKANIVTEWITAIGPTQEPIQVMTLVQAEKCPGIKYEYLLPINTNAGVDEDYDNGSSETEGKRVRSSKPSSETAVATAAVPTVNARRPRKYIWKVVKFTPCSKTCGTGVQSPIIKCFREGSRKMSPPKKCLGNKPVMDENQLKCNTQPCPAYWHTTEWSECKCESSIKTRNIRCVQELSPNRIIQVHEGSCLATAPSMDEPCECEAPKSTEYTQDRKRPVRPKLPPSIIGRHEGGKNHVQKPHSRRSGHWLTADWNEQCSSECGTGIQYRTIFCDRSAPNTDRCNQKLTPDTSRQCSSQAKCDTGSWFTGPWSNCTGDCFNLSKSRNVYCIRDDRIVDGALCQEEKPEEISPCNVADVAECKPKWHTSQWTQCTKQCNGGKQRRVVRCLEPNVVGKTMQESSECLYKEKPEGFRACNSHSCPSTEEETNDSLGDSGGNSVQNDVFREECVDEFVNCHMVIKARLCQHSYYKKHCCRTCG